MAVDWLLTPRERTVHMTPQGAQKGNNRGLGSNSSEVSLQWLPPSVRLHVAVNHNLPEQHHLLVSKCPNT